MKVTNDFKMVIVLDESLPTGLLCNTAAVLSLSLGKEVEGLIDKDLVDRSGISHAGLTNTPLPILKSNSQNLKDLLKNGREKNDILTIDITDAAQTTKNYQDYEALLKSKTTDELKILGIALAGDKQTIKALTGNLGLLR